MFFWIAVCEEEGVPGGASGTGTRSACRPLTEGEERLEVQVPVRFTSISPSLAHSHVLHSKGQFVCICPFPVPVKATKSHPICPTNMETGKIRSSSPMPGFFYTSTNKKSQIQKIFERLGLLLLYQNIQHVGANAVT